jgi:hypothetical protein
MANGSAMRRLQMWGAIWQRFHHRDTSQISPKATKMNISARNAVLRAATARKASTSDKCMARLAVLRSPMGNSPMLSLFRFRSENSHGKKQPPLFPLRKNVRHRALLGLCAMPALAPLFGDNRVHALGCPRSHEPWPGRGTRFMIVRVKPPSMMISSPLM